MRIGFNPLHCGAVVASGTAVPVAGQRLKFQSPSLRGSGRFPCRSRKERLRTRCFNPLHCGAVVASAGRRNCAGGARRVSIPFIAGQWSLPLNSHTDNLRPPSFNPLHCGAVVASSGAGGGRARTAGFQSPSLRGSGRFEARARRRAPGRAFQSPSLRGSGRFGRGEEGPPGSPPGFNPLHCGAVVASPRDVLSRGGPRPSFNPLHCGAVVASGPSPGREGSRGAFQSPSLRGSGRFSRGSRR